MIEWLRNVNNSYMDAQHDKMPGIHSPAFPYTKGNLSSYPI